MPRLERLPSSSGFTAYKWITVTPRRTAQAKSEQQSHANTAPPPPPPPPQPILPPVVPPAPARAEPARSPSPAASQQPMECPRKPVVRSLRPPRKLALPSDQKPIVRPSFQSVLASCANAAESAIKNLQATLQPPDQADVLLKVQCRKFTVGKFTSSWPSTVTFFTDRAEYFFMQQLPSGEKDKVLMQMWYADMERVQLSDRRQTLKFKIGRPLEHFPAGYDHLAPEHSLSIEFNSAADLRDFQRDVYEKLLLRSKP